MVNFSQTQQQQTAMMGQFIGATTQVMSKNSGHWRYNKVHVIVNTQLLLELINNTRFLHLISLK